MKKSNPKTIANHISYEDLIYADGISGISIGPSQTRVELYYISGKDEQGKNTRENCKTIVLPTHAWFDFARFIMKNIEDNSERIIQSLDENKEKIINGSKNNFKKVE